LTPTRWFRDGQSRRASERPLRVSGSVGSIAAGTVEALIRTAPKGGTGSDDLGNLKTVEFSQPGNGSWTAIFPAIARKGVQDRTGSVKISTERRRRRLGNVDPVAAVQRWTVVAGE
jgi:hypothetical protein